MKTLVVYDKNTCSVCFTQSINDTEDVEYDSIIADVPVNRIVARVENGVTNSHKKVIKSYKLVLTFIT